MIMKTQIYVKIIKKNKKEMIVNKEIYHSL